MAKWSTASAGKASIWLGGLLGRASRLRYLFLKILCCLSLSLNDQLAIRAYLPVRDL